MYQIKGNYSHELAKTSNLNFVSKHRRQWLVESFIWFVCVVFDRNFELDFLLNYT